MSKIVNSFKKKKYEDFSVVFPRLTYRFNAVTTYRIYYANILSFFNQIEHRA